MARLRRPEAAALATAALLLAAASAPAAAAAAPTVANVTVEYEQNPTAVDVTWNPRPRFAWQVAGGVQTAYRIVVAGAPSGAVVWDSGTTSSTQAAQISFGGAAALANDADFSVALTVTFADGSVVAAPAARFGTGPDAAAWAAAATWLGGCTSAQASPQLRLSFALADQPVTRARAYATGLGVYALYLNGARVGGGVDVLTPGWSTVPTARVLANAYDVAADLRSGAENVVGMRLGQAKYVRHPIPSLTPNDPPTHPCS